MKNIILDFDSTIVTVEGIDELARLKGVYAEINNLTDQAMNGQLPLEAVFAKRLELIRPTVTDLQAIAQVYLNALSPHVDEFIHFAQKKHNVFVVTGGYRQAVAPTTQQLGIEDAFLFANILNFDGQGKYAKFDQTLPLWQQTGKAQIIDHIQQTHPFDSIIIGDGMSDALAKTHRSVFIHYTGVVKREEVAKLADFSVKSFRDPLLMRLLE